MNLDGLNWHDFVPALSCTPWMAAVIALCALATAAGTFWLGRDGYNHGFLHGLAIGAWIITVLFVLNFDFVGVWWPSSVLSWAAPIIWLFVAAGNVLLVSRETSPRVAPVLTGLATAIVIVASQEYESIKYTNITRDTTFAYGFGDYQPHESYELVWPLMVFAGVLMLAAAILLASVWLKKLAQRRGQRVIAKWLRKKRLELDSQLPADDFAGGRLVLQHLREAGPFGSTMVKPYMRVPYPIRRFRPKPEHWIWGALRAMGACSPCGYYYMPPKDAGH